LHRDSHSLACTPAVFLWLRSTLAALLVATLLHATPAASQIVVGRVIDASDSIPVDGVRITLADTLTQTRRDVLSNEAGEFMIAIGAPGAYLLWASRLGYATIRTPAIEIGDGEVVEVEVWLDVEPVEVDPLTVVVRRPETQRERDLRGFYDRVDRYGERQLGSTQIYTREALEAWDALSLVDAFELYIRWAPYGSGCNPKVFLNGRRLYGRFLSDLRYMSISSLEGIELYSGVGPGEGRFWDTDGCGVVLLWTRVLPGEAGGLGVVETLALAGAAALLILQAFWLIF
jgi:hypothetical protein